MKKHPLSCRLFPVGLASVILMLCLFISTTASAVVYYGTAQISAPGTGKVHLRQSPSTGAASLGLYYSGTEVTCLSSPANEWVMVRIGTEEGYMMSLYLYQGGSVTPRKPTQYVNLASSSLLNLRSSPSQQASVIRQVKGGTAVIVQGETNTKWSYVQIGNSMGYVMTKFLSSTYNGWGPSPTSVPQPTYRPQPTTNAVTVEFAVQRLWTQAASYTYLPDPTDNRNVASIAVHINGNVSDLRFYQVSASQQYDGRIQCNSYQLLLSVRQPKQGDLFVLDQPLPGTVPVRALAFTDSYGQRQIYYFSLSTVDGTPQLIPFDSFAAGVQL